MSKPKIMCPLCEGSGHIDDEVPRDGVHGEGRGCKDPDCDWCKGAVAQLAAARVRESEAIRKTIAINQGQSVQVLTAGVLACIDELRRRGAGATR